MMALCHCFARRVKRLRSSTEPNSIPLNGLLLCMGLFCRFLVGAVTTAVAAKKKPGLASEAGPFDLGDLLEDQPRVRERIMKLS